MNVVIEDNQYLEKFFRQHESYAETIKKEIYDKIEMMITQKAYKIKTVRGVKYKDKTVFEYKIVLNAHFKCRVAYIIEGDTVDVFFLSTTLIKAEFTKLVAALSFIETV